MKAIQIHQFGGPEVLQINDVESQPLASGQVRIKTCGAGVNPIDWKTRQGGGAAQFLGEPPLTLGWECSGTVLEVSADVGDFKVGDKVAGLLNFPQAGNCYAQEVLAGADQLALCSQEIDLLAAGGLPLAGLTAWQALFDGADTQANHRVLVLAAAGGVGHLAVQLAKWKGAWVAGTASSANHQYLKQLGCDQLIDYHREQAADQLSDIDVIIDCVGGQTAIEALSCLKPDGVLITLPSVTAAEVVAAAE
ncbi:MAG: NADP-dependent oxidoreductase, partial [Motiliproteus sp.]|nr:NADP-dependent oxidoreductase [Motiliproteus sp.]